MTDKRKLALKRLFWSIMAYVIDENVHKLTDRWRWTTELWGYACFWIHQHHGDSLWDSRNKQWIENWRCGPVFVTRVRTYLKIGNRRFIISHGKVGQFFV